MGIPADVTRSKPADKPVQFSTKRRYFLAIGSSVAAIIWSFIPPITYIQTSNLTTKANTFTSISSFGMRYGDALPNNAVSLTNGFGGYLLGGTILLILLLIARIFIAQMWIDFIGAVISLVLCAGSLANTALITSISTHASSGIDVNIHSIPNLTIIYYFMINLGISTDIIRVQKAQALQG